MKSKKKVIAAILGLAAVICIGIGCFSWIQEQNAGKVYEEIREEAKATEEAEEIPTPETEAVEEEPEEEPAEEPVEIPVDFASLQAENPNIYAWIKVPGTDVDYPILQKEEDNAWYLTHNVNGESDKAGAIYTENYNQKDFEDPNTVIYGHNMKNGTMFRTLHNFEDRTFFDEHREVLIYTPDAIRHYQIFAAYVYDSRHLLLNFDFNDPEEYQSYLNEIFALRDMTSFVDTSIEVTTKDKILTLSTCYKGMADRRYLVQAVLVSIES